MKCVFLFVATNLALVALVAVSTGLLRNMPRAQVEAVLSHEISHAAKGEMVTLALLQGVLVTFVIFLARFIGSIVDRVFTRNIREQAHQWLFAAGISRRREFRARGGADLAGFGNMIRE